MLLPSATISYSKKFELLFLIRKQIKLIVSGFLIVCGQVWR
jgi:hypothetical protein